MIRLRSFGTLMVVGTTGSTGVFRVQACESELTQADTAQMVGITTTTEPELDLVIETTTGPSSCRKSNRDAMDPRWELCWTASRPNATTLKAYPGLARDR